MVKLLNIKKCNDTNSIPITKLNMSFFYIEKVKEIARRGTKQEKIHAKKILLDKFNITI